MDRRTPNLFIVGAPKAGTTFMHHALGLADDVYMSEVKEPGYFTSSRDARRGLGYYLDAYFAAAAGHSIRGESTPWYLYSADATARIARMSSDEPPRIVVGVRKPSERAFSMYLDLVRAGREDRSFEDAIDDELRREAGDSSPPDVYHRYVWCGQYARHIERWREQFGEDRVHVAVFDDLTERPSEVWEELGRFLHSDLGPSRFEGVSDRDRNPRGSLRWPRLERFIRRFEGRDSPTLEWVKQALPPGLHRRVLQRVVLLNRSGESVSAVSEAAVRDRIDDVCAEQTVRLETLIGRPLTGWTTGSSGVPSSNGSSDRTGDHDESSIESGPPPLEPVQVLHVVGRSHRRGAELVALELAHELDLLGHENRLVAIGRSQGVNLEPDLPPLVDRSDLGLLAVLHASLRLRRLLRRDPVDVVIAHGGWAVQVVGFGVPRRGPTVVWQRILELADVCWRPPQFWWWLSLVRRVDGAVALTGENIKELERLHFDGPVWTIPNSANAINPEWQHLGVGDAVRLAPELALTVAVAVAPRTLVLRGGVLPGAVTAPYDFTWTFVLTAVSPITTRLVVRERYHYLTWWVSLVIEPVTVLSFLMSQRMLRGIRDRAEHSRNHQATKESEPSS